MTTKNEPVKIDRLLFDYYKSYPELVKFMKQSGKGIKCPLCEREPEGCHCEPPPARQSRDAVGYLTQ